MPASNKPHSGSGEATASRPSKNYPADWDSRRIEVLERDGFQCVNCQRIGAQWGPAKLQVHHAISVAAGGSHEISNLVTVCERCHSAEHGEGRAVGYYFDMPYSEPDESWKALLQTVKGRHSDVFRWDHDRRRYFIPLADFEERLSPAEQRLFELHDALEPNWEKD